MDKKRWGVHEGHCCLIHGCKYGDEDCPVENSQTKQDYICEQCDYQGFKKVEHITEYVMYQELLKKAKENKDESITVNVDFLDRMLNPEPDWY